MPRDRRDLISDLYHEALARAPEERGAFLTEACDGDEGLRQEVESLLDVESASERFLERPAAGLAASAPGVTSMIDRRLGPYTIVAMLGAGGMGEVYRARDRKLGRDVAIKILPAHFALDPERRARFAREARLLATLNHPHIGAIYGLEEVGDLSALVLELVEGPTLAERLERGPLPIAQALAIARQIAEALDEAHQKGIIHRDLKPANIVLQSSPETADEVTVKVLDFGLAKATVNVGAVHLEHPILTSPALMTGPGVILGTAAYMSPEQAKGHEADRRSDVWAFGCVVYEMLTGCLPFAAEGTSATMASVLRDDPDWQLLPEEARPLASVLRRLLEKDPARRLRDMGDVKLLIADAHRQAGPVASVVARPRRWWIVGAALLAVTAGLVSSAIVLSWRRGAIPVSRVERFPLGSVATPPSIAPPGRNVAISPDGTHVVYTTGSPPRNQLVVRSLDRLDGRVIASADRGRDPFFSDDGRQIGYATVDELKRVSVDGGPSVRICGLKVVFRGGSWGPDGSIVFAQAGGLGLFRVPATGGEPQGMAAPDTSKGELDYLRPIVLPDGRSVLYTVTLRGGQTRIVARRFAGGDQITVVEPGFGAVYLASGHLLYSHDQRLMAVAFDAAALRTTGSPVPVQEDVSIKPVTGVANVAAATDGTVVYVPGGVSEGSRHIVWADRHGALTRALEPALENPRHPRLSPDGQRLAITIGSAMEGHVWVHYLTGAPRPGVPLTFDNHNLLPIWSPNGERILFLTRGRTNYLNAVAADGSSLEPETLATDDGPLMPMDWVRQTDLVLVAQVREQTKTDLELFQVTDRKWRDWPRPPFEESDARASPDGKWVAFVSDRTGRPEVWVRSFLDAASLRRISTDGGRDPVWSADGSELFYRNGSTIMTVKVAAALPQIRVESIEPLFTGGFDPVPRGFDVAPDGRFLMVAAGMPDSSATIVLVRGLVRSK